MATDRRNDPSNWSLATAMTEHDRQLIQATLDLAYEVMRDEGREASLDEIVNSLTGRFTHETKHYPRLD